MIFFVNNIKYNIFCKNFRCNNSKIYENYLVKASFLSRMQCVPPFLSRMQCVPPFLNRMQCVPPFLSRMQCVPPFLNRMQCVPPFYDENSRTSTHLNYKKVNVWKLIIKKTHNNSGTKSPPSSKVRGLSTQCEGIIGRHQRGRHPAHCNSVTTTPWPPFLKFFGLPFLNFFIIHPRKTFLNAR